MSQRDESFRKTLAKVFHDWQGGIATALRRGQSEGTVRRDLDAREVASFLIAMYEGYVTLAKNAQDVNVLKVGIRNIVGGSTQFARRRSAQARVGHERSDEIRTSHNNRCVCFLLAHGRFQPGGVRRAPVSFFAVGRARQERDAPQLRHGYSSTPGRLEPATFFLGESTPAGGHGGHRGLSRS